MNQMQLTTPWRHSIKFKLFLLMTGYLLLTVAAISFQNGHQFLKVMSKENSEDANSAATQISGNIASVLKFWTSTLYTTAHHINFLGTDRGEQFSKQAKAVLLSNKEYVSMSLHSLTKGQKPKLEGSAFTPHQAEPNFEKIEPSKLKKEVIDLQASNIENAAEYFSKNPDSQLFIQNLEKKLGAPILTLYVPFKTKNSDQIIIATLTAWADSLLDILKDRPYEKRYLLTQFGSPFLMPESEAKNNQPLLSKQAIDDLNTGRTIRSFEERKDSTGRTILQVGSKVPSAPLIFVLRKDPSQAMAMIWFIITKGALLSWIILLVTVLASFMASGRVTRAIRAATDATLRLAQGDLDAQISVRTKDEIGLMSHAVNHMAKQIKGLLAVEIEAARQEKELKTAQVVQQTLFKKSHSEDKAFQVDGLYEPASECAGDWWYEFNISESKKVIVIADATGHGASAALIVAVAYSYFKTTSEFIKQGLFAPPGPSGLLSDLNRILYESGHGTTTMTMFICEIDSETSKIRYSNAGHVTPILIPAYASDVRLPKARSNNAAKTRVLPLMGAGAVLGSDIQSKFEEHSMNVSEGDRLLLYTDGLVECVGVDGMPLRPMTLRKQVAEIADNPQGENLCQALVASARERLGSVPRDDDITVVVARLTNAFKKSERRQPGAA